jgi:hypothetical protein
VAPGQQVGLDERLAIVSSEVGTEMVSTEMVSTEMVSTDADGQEGR